MPAFSTPFRYSRHSLRFGSFVVATLLAGSTTGLPCVATDTQESSAPAAPLPTILRGVVAGNRAYLPAAPEMIAPARARFIPHPTGRYVLIIRDEEALPPGPDTGQETTGGAALLLYDSVAHRTRTLWEQPAAHGTRKGSVVEAQWLPGVDCAVVTVDTQVLDGNTAPAETPSTMSLLFIDAARDTRARTLLTDTDTILLHFSPRTAQVAVETMAAGTNAFGGDQTSSSPTSTTLRFLEGQGRLSQPLHLSGNPFSRLECQ